MTIYIAPDRTGYPDNFQAEISAELEPLTGTDMLISSFPFGPDQSTLQAHIDSRGLFVQIKIGYDALSFDGIHNFCARVQECKIPKSQAILLLVGDFWRDDSGLFRVRSQKPYGDTTWRNFRRAMIGAMARGITVYPEFLPSMNELPEWIEDYQDMLSKFEDEGKRELYPASIKPMFENEDIWQEMTEVDKNDPRYTMVAGLAGFGEKKAMATFKYIIENLPHIRIEHSNDKNEYVTCLYHFWKVLTDEDEKGKATHNVPGWGDKSRQDFRQKIGLAMGENLCIRKMSDFDYTAGWEAFGQEFIKRVNQGNNPQEAFGQLMEMAKEF